MYSGKYIRRLIYVALCAAVVFAGGCGQQLRKYNGGDDSDEVRVMSFNIRYGSADDGQNSWPKRREMVFDVIRDYRPNVLGLQEALKFQVDEIMEAVEGYELIGVGREDGKGEGEYSCILYRTDRFDVTDEGTFWLSGRPTEPGSITWGNACTRICSWGRFVDKRNGRGFYLYNTHLDHRSQPSRLKSVSLIAHKINARTHKEPYILTGDFNAAEDNDAILYLKGKKWQGGIKLEYPMVDAFRVLHPDTDDVGTFNGFKGAASGGKIDYVFVSPAVKVTKADIIRSNSKGRYPSDHFPVTATVLIGSMEE